MEEHFLPYNKAWLERPLARPDDLLTAHLCCVAHGLVGEALLELGRAEEALVHFEKSVQWVKIKLEMDPNNARAARDQSNALRLIGAAQLALGQTELGAQSLAEAVRHAEALVARDPANGPAQLELTESLRAQAKGYAIQVGLAGIAPARQMELWQRALQSLTRCQQRMELPELRRNKAALETRAKALTQAMNEAQSALAKIAAGAGSISPLPVKDKLETQQPTTKTK